MIHYSKKLHRSLGNSIFGPLFTVATKGLVRRKGSNIMWPGGNTVKRKVFVWF